MKLYVFLAWSAQRRFRRELLFSSARAIRPQATLLYERTRQFPVCSGLGSHQASKAAAKHSRKPFLYFFFSRWFFSVCLKMSFANITKSAVCLVLITPHFVALRAVHTRPRPLQHHDARRHRDDHSGLHHSRPHTRRRSQGWRR